MLLFVEVYDSTSSGRVKPEGAAHVYSAHVVENEGQDDVDRHKEQVLWDRRKRVIAPFPLEVKGMSGRRPPGCLGFTSSL